MIKGYCKSNIDDFKCKKWPEAFVAVPRIGDQIKSPSGLVARVYSITHFQEGLNHGYEPITLYSGEPFIIVEIGRYVPGARM